MFHHTIAKQYWQNIVARKINIVVSTGWIIPPYNVAFDFVRNID